ncbi:MAG: hypothetical protein AMJ54_13370 [Deltaproteobacteria bacterium SG8_13]|nr:MAG: hypothetical protein AMJ54_13370 [Deltaproteobacteria bacterium SG8_13]
MAGENCATCGLRKKYDKRPKSLLGRLWRFHANWCPGWKAYMLSLPEGERIGLADKYGMKKFK